MTHNNADDTNRNNVIQYLVKLKPADKFFFGGEKTFGENNETYFIHSLPFPQQTTILGMIRRELLIQNNLAEQGRGRDRIIDMNRAEAAIGKESFTIRGNEEQDFGWIKAVSPVFLASGRKYYIKTPFDTDIPYEKTGKKPAGCLIGDHGQREFIPFMNKYKAKAKNGLNEGFRQHDSHQVLSFNDVFKNITQVGITKNNRTEKEEKAFFKQTFYTFHKEMDMGFAFFLELEGKNNNEKIILTKSFVMLGAEGNLFKMEVEQADSLSFMQLFTSAAVSGNLCNRIVLLSDAYIKKDIFNVCDFAVTRLIPFRNIYNKTLAGANSRPVKSRYSLAARGSVFYVNNCNKAEEILNNKNLQKIGYNIYQTVKERE